MKPVSENTIAERGHELAGEFALFDQPMDKYEYIIELGRDLPPLDEAFKRDENVVKGCQSTVWLVASLDENGRMDYQADSNTVITKGIIAILIRVLSGQPPQAVAVDDFSFIDEIDLRSHLSSQRSNGLSAMLGRMKQYAEIFSRQSAANPTQN